VQTAYQRRNDLWQFSKYGKGAADFEKGTLTAVIEARAKQLKQQLTLLILLRAISCIQLCSKWQQFSFISYSRTIS
jgi:hypothetical protein